MKRMKPIFARVFASGLFAMGGIAAFGQVQEVETATAPVEANQVPSTPVQQPTVTLGGACVSNDDCEDNNVCTRDECIANVCTYTGGLNCNVTFTTTGVGGGQINISGATLLRNFFDTFPGATNDWVNADEDYDCYSATNMFSGTDDCGILGDDPAADPEPGTECPYRGFVSERSLACAPPANFASDQLATSYGTGTITTNWLLHYRGVGSVEGYQEFIDYQICGTLPATVPSEAGVVNRVTYANLGLPTGALFACNPDTNSPICADSVDLGILDVLTAWGTQDVNLATASADWDVAPGSAGYGLQPNIPNGGTILAQLARIFKDCNGDTVIDAGERLNLASDPAADDAQSIFDTTVAWVPIEYIANRGVGVSDKDGLPISATACRSATGTAVACDAENRGGDMDMTAIQHLFVLGRLPNGENLVAATRDTGSGTRNGIMNTSGIDPSWGIGDNRGDRLPDDTLARLQPGGAQSTNCGGSGIIENAVRWRRLAIGYTGLAGPSRAAADAKAGQYELLNIKFDDRGGTAYVRPSIESVLKNGDPTTGFQLGGNASFASVGDPHHNHIVRDSLDVVGGTLPVASDLAAAYLVNIIQSSLDFTLSPSLDDNANMPGEAIARRFYLPNGVDELPLPTDPTNFQPNSLLDVSVRTYHLCNNEISEIVGNLPAECGSIPVATGGTSVPSYGEVNRAGSVPQRRSGFVFQDNPVATTSYTYGPAGGFTIAANALLGERNQVQGDWNNDRERDILDFPKMMAMANALEDEPTWADFLDEAHIIDNPPGGAPYAGTAGAQTGGNYIIPHIIGDHNGDGNFDSEDVRYAADGLALVTSLAGSAGKVLDRRAGFTAVDTEWLALNPGDNNYFNTTLANGSYNLGDSRADLAGGAATTPNAEPRGSDGAVDAVDIDYVYAQIRNFSGFEVIWNDPTNRVSSAIDPVTKKIADLSADINGDLIINRADVCEIVRGILETRFGDADLNGAVNAGDQAIVTANLGLAGGWAQGDFNGDGIVNAADQTILTDNLGGTACCDDSECAGTEVCGTSNICESTGFACASVVDCRLDVANNNACNCASCAGVCSYVCTTYGNANCSGGVTLDDILCVLAGFGTFSACPNGDIFPCSGSGSITLDDILAVLAAFGGANPCGCNPGGTVPACN